jgi:hypothetical protein
MSDEPKKRSRAGIGWALVAIFVLYPLSMGPVLDFAGPIPGNRRMRVQALYSPIFYFAHRNYTVYRIVNGYCEWWDVYLGI